MRNATHDAAADSAIATAPPATAATPDAPTNWGIHLQPSGGLFVDRASLVYLRMSGLALELALQLARTQSFSAMVQARSSLARADRDTMERELLAALKGHPMTEAWLDGMLGARLRFSGSTDAYLPLSATLQLTNRCNLSCTFCYASSGEPFAAELSTAEWLKVIERLATAGVAALTLTGGEPTLARDFPKILTTAAALVESVDIFTNALAWPDRLLDLVAALGNVQVQVSIDGLAERHDRIRGRAGAFDASLALIRRLAEADVSVIAAMTVVPENYRDVGAVIAALGEAGARAFRAGAAVPVGRGAVEGFGLPPEQRQHVVEQFVAARARDTFGMEVIGWDQCRNGLEDDFAASGLPVDFMTPGYLNWYVRADGVVTPCQIEERGFGHILKEPLTDIGAPERLALARTESLGCQCIRRIQTPGTEAADLPFGFAAGGCHAR